ncbi:Na/H antiporter [Diplonema papillatum]|nr:Na/H antiporter [Diplonema papillatum]
MVTNIFVIALLFVAQAELAAAKGRQVVPKTATTKRRQYEHADTTFMLDKLRPALEKKRLFQKKSELEIRKLTNHSDSELALHIIKRRRLRLNALTSLETSLNEAVAAFDSFLTNFTTASLKSSLQGRLNVINGNAINTTSMMNEAAELEKQEQKKIKAQRDEAQGSNTKEEESTIDKLISSVDSEISQLLEKMDSENTAGVRFSKAAMSDDSTVETVVKMQEEGSSIVSHLIDNQGNQYVLSLPRDSFVHYEDGKLIHDIVLVISVCFFMACIARLAHLPLFFGYIVGGTVIAPSQMNLLHSTVQIETLAQFGVYFLLFLLGVEFSLSKLRSVLKAAVIGGIAGMVIVWAACTIALSSIFKAPTSEGILVGFCVSLSSTIVVMRMMTPNELNASYGQLLLAVLVIQDVCLGLMVASVPLLNSPTIEFDPYIKMLSWLAFLCMCAGLFSRFCVPRFLAFIDSGHELFLLGLCTICFLSMTVTEKVGLSMEVGCFLTGITLAPHRKWVHKVEDSIRPLQEFWCAIFFTAIGIHISPSFLFQEAAALFLITITIVGLKWLCGFLLFHLFFDFSTLQASLVGLGLSQMSEFSFVIAAHGKSYGLINREVYFMLLGITALSLVLTPIVWKFHPKPNSRSDSTKETLFAVAFFKQDTKNPSNIPNSKVELGELESFVWGHSFAVDHVPNFANEYVAEQIVIGIDDVICSSAASS